MGDLGPDEDRTLIPCFAAPLCNPDPDSVRVETWIRAENPAREVLKCIRPTLDSEEKRKDVIEYVQELIRCNLNLQVFSYGSVPLKTYLPDGDIDLTVLNVPNYDEILPTEVFRVLQEEEKNGNSEFELKDTQFIDAEVKLVKCIVDDIIVDISFNQLGGLCTLCFLEQVDRLAGKSHLFKRSIMLIKAWCYYESRILGAHHGLISTYALETLVLYIFHVFHASLNSPLQVLYRFLDYYAKFDWDNYCISLDGPVCKSSSNGSAVETLENEGTDVLLGDDFRKNCIDMFIVPSEADSRIFCLKNLNIVDPLKENNNLGRSVHRGNYFRIRSAFRYGARRLGKILQEPNTHIRDEIKSFFRNTLKRHQPDHSPDTILPFPANGYDTLTVSSPTEPYFEDDLYSDSDLEDYLHNDHSPPPLTESSIEEESMTLETWMNGDTVSLSVNGGSNGNSSDDLSFDNNEKDYVNGGSNGDSSDILSFDNNEKDYVNGGSNGDSSDILSFDNNEKDYVNGGSNGDSSDILSFDNNEKDCVNGGSNGNSSDNLSFDSNEKDFVNGGSNGNPYGNLSFEDNEYSCVNGGDNGNSSDNLSFEDNEKKCVNEGDNGNSSDNFSFEDNEKDASDDSVEADLTGDYDAHVRNLLYGQGCHGYAFSSALVWANPMRGTGLYIPVVSLDTYDDEQPPPGSYEDEQPPARQRGRSRGPQPVSNASLSNQTHPQISQVNSNHAHPQVSQVNSTASASANQPRKLVFGSFRPMSENPSNGQSLKVDACDGKQERIKEDSLYLKDEAEFPPLSI
ncbi:uncharacterized protein LOC143631900 [Bidens hawaiensis]|uniref:uncharacterized protein LOC143631900 n=1 Tax=Bidens hawaiensis TaxID=980011 RepID=UPI00404B8D7F